MTIYYLTKFTRGYRNRRWWDADERDDARRFVKHKKDTYRARGKVIKVKVVK